jgi:hypothetical protein
MGPTSIRRLRNLSAIWSRSQWDDFRWTMLNVGRYIKLQEEYIKDEQRYGFQHIWHQTDANMPQESEERVGESARGDQTYSECTLGHWTVYGGDRSKVSLVVHASRSSLTNDTALVSYNHQQVPTMSSEYSLPSTASCSSHPLPLPFTATQTPLSISYLPKPTPRSQCWVQMRSQM